MELLKSLKNLFRGWRDEVVEAAADPIRDGKYAIEDAERLIAAHRQSIVGVVVANKSLERQLKYALDDVKKWESILTVAEEIDKPRTQTHLNEAKKLAIRLRKEIDLNQIAMKRLQDEIAKAELKILSAKSNYSQLAARVQSAEIRQSLSSASDKFGNASNPLAALDDLAKQAEAEEDKAAALEELSTSTDQGLEEKYAVTDESVDASFEALFGKK